MTRKTHTAAGELLNISHVLANADKTYSAFTTACVSAPKDIQTHLAPVMEVAAAFTKLSGMLSAGNAARDGKARAGISALLSERKQAYAAETKRLTEEIAPQVPEGARLAYYLNVPAEQTLDGLGSMYGTASIAGHVDDLKELAERYHAKTAPGKLEASLEAIDRTAAQQEEQLGLPKGSMQAFIHLDRSSFLHSLTNVDGGPSGSIAQLLDKKTFTEKLTRRIDRDTGVAFHSTVDAMLSRITGRGTGNTLQ